MDFLKEWMMNLLAIIIIISISILCGLICYLLIEYLDFIGVGIILLILYSLVITLKNRCN